MNKPHEIELMKQQGYRGVNFIKTEKTLHHYFGKSLVSINAMIDLARSFREDLLLVNSDIILCDLPEFKQDGMTVLSRYDYNEMDGELKRFDAGFDGFYIPVEFLNIFPPTIYGMGAAWFDYSLPYRFMLNSIPVYYPQGVFAKHKIHPTQYSYNEWLYLAEFFRWEFNCPRHFDAPAIATHYLAEIRKGFI